ncbi:uncharacterized protein [Lolium perenne]|uniref:uncharacterized protein n=1 Tax=Lolium perenne TaxID=4522 RepID=UPI0021F566FB|nr:uncharacterized protein LOC127323444 [Lolium perenne]
MEDEVRCEKLRLKAKEEEEKNKEEKGKGKVNEDEEKEEEDEKRKGKHEEKELSHGCFGSAILPWNYGRRARGDPKDMSSSALNETLLTPQQSKPMPTPSGAANPRIADATAMTMRTSKPKPKVYQFETRLMVPRFRRPTTYNVGACPGLDQSTSGSKDPQMVKITLCVLTRPAENFSERDLVSTIHETLKAVIAQYNASQLINESELVSWEIRQVLTERTRNFGISIDNVSIISLSFEKQLTHDTEETKQMTTQEAEQESRSAMIKSQEDDQIWNKRQLGYIFDLSTALGLIFLIRQLLPAGYDRWMLLVFAAVWGVGSVGLPVGLFGTSRFEKNWSRHVGRFISLSCSLLVIYGIYILALRVSGAPELTLSLSPIKITDADANADWWMTVWFSTIAVLVLIGHLYSWIRGCCTGGDRDNVP